MTGGKARSGAMSRIRRSPATGAKRRAVLSMCPPISMLIVIGPRPTRLAIGSGSLVSILLQRHDHGQGETFMGAVSNCASAT